MFDESSCPSDDYLHLALDGTVGLWSSRVAEMVFYSEELACFHEFAASATISLLDCVV